MIDLAIKGPLSGYFSDVIDFGWQNQSNIKFLLRNSNLCIYPSRQIDADPIIVKESLFLNIPVFISNNNAHSDLINHLFGNMFVIKDWSIVDDDYITDALKSIINKPIINIELFDNFSNIHNNYCKLFNNE